MNTDQAAARPAARPATWQRGVVLMLVTTLCFGVLDALAKVMTAEVNVLQLVWGRYFFHFAIFGVFLFARAKPRQLLTTRRPWLQAVRSLMLVLSTFTFWWGLMYLPLALATVIGFAGPLMVTALSVPMLGEKVGVHRWGAVVAGLVGVLIIMRPGAGEVHWAVVLPLLTALIYAFYQIATRMLSHSDDLLATAFFSAIGGVVLTSALLPFVWEPLDLRQWLMLAAMGFLGGLGHFLLIQAFATAPASLLAPFNYTSLIWTAALGYLIFGDVPDGWTWVGATIVIASGLYIVHRERVRRVAAEA